MLKLSQIMQDNERKNVNGIKTSQMIHSGLIVFCFSNFLFNTYRFSFSFVHYICLNRLTKYSFVCLQDNI